MLRLLPQVKSFRGLRRNSSVANLARDIASGRLVKAIDVENALSNKSLTPDEIKLLHGILKSDIDNELTDEILAHGIPQDFSLYFTAARKGRELKWTAKALEPLIRCNPGRVFSLTDLLEKHAGDSVSDAVRLNVVNKLLLGENSEIGEEEFMPSDNNVAKAIELLNEVANLRVSETHLKTLFEVLVGKNAVPVMSMLKIDGLYKWLDSCILGDVKDPKIYILLSQLIFKHDPLILSSKSISKILFHGGFLKDGMSQLTKNFSLSEQPLSLKVYLEKVLEFVERNRLDLNKLDPEALLLRLQLVQSYGIDNNDVDLALRKFHAYQAHEKFGIDLVQANMVKVCCYQSFKTLNETFLKIAETLVNPDGLAVSTVAQMILAKSRFSSDASLEMYNEYINQVSKKVNEVTGRSPSGVLTESLMIASLYDNDREFAQLLYEKAVRNGIVSDENEIALMKKLFKAYGDAFVQDDWKVARPIFAEYVLDCIKRTT